MLCDLGLAFFALVGLGAIGVSIAGLVAIFRAD
jgi:hypothetical protein